VPGPATHLQGGHADHPALTVRGATRERFEDVGGYRDVDIGDGLRAVYRARTVGNRVSEHRWRGIFRIRVRVLRGDRLVDVCSARTRWRVLRRD